MLFLYGPIIVIVIYSFNTGRLLVSFDGFGFDAFLTLLEKPAIQSAVRVSLVTAFIAAVIATVLGTLAGIAMARHPGKWVWWFLGLLLLVSVTPEIVDAIALLPWFVFLGQDRGIRTRERSGHAGAPVDRTTPSTHVQFPCARRNARRPQSGRPRLHQIQSANRESAHFECALQASGSL